MNKTVKTTIFFIVLILFVLLFIYAISNNFSDDTEMSSRTDISVKDEGRLLAVKFYDDLRFKASLVNSQSVEIPSDKVYGGIVNHHLTADNLIAEFFKSISLTQPDIVIVVGPNHTGSGVKTVHTSIWNWDTPYGSLLANRSLVDYLLKGGLADINFEFMENEHAISSLVPYIKYFMPKSEIVPIILSSSVQKDAAIELGKGVFNEIKDKNYIVISSVDFSHYLSLEEADKRDTVTKSLLLNREINQINNLNNDYLDSPASIIFLLTMMNEAGAENQIILNQSNSARILPGDSKSTTSYFTVAYFKN